MSDTLRLLLATPVGSLLVVVAGAALGTMFYGGLWWTACRLATARRPGALVVASLLLRTGATLAGFFVVAGGDWVRLLLCLSGFVLARPVVTWLTRPRAAAASGLLATTGAPDAP